VQDRTRRNWSSAFLDLRLRHLDARFASRPARQPGRSRRECFQACLETARQLRVRMNSSTIEWAWTVADLTMVAI